jgi:hypothetical protein
MPLIVSLASLPHRQSSLLRTIDSLLVQDRRPDAIHIQLCRAYTRFPDTRWTTDDVRDIADKDPSLIHVHLHDTDHGPSTKVLGLDPHTFTTDLNTTHIVIVDDDIEYPPTLLSTLGDRTDGISSFNYTFDSPQRFVEFTDGTLFKGDLLRMKLPGYLGYSFPAVDLAPLQAFMHMILSSIPEVWHDDDSIVTAYFRTHKRTIFWYPKMDIIPNDVHWEEKALQNIHGSEQYRLVNGPRLINHLLQKQTSEDE